MNNMRSYSLAFYPETKKKMEAIKNGKQMTWDELFNYLMESKNEEKGTAQKEVDYQSKKISLNEGD